MRDGGGGVKEPQRPKRHREPRGALGLSHWCHSPRKQESRRVQDFLDSRFRGNDRGGGGAVGSLCLCASVVRRNLRDISQHLALEGMAAVAVLDLHDPEVGVAFDGAGDIGVGIGLSRSACPPGPAASRDCRPGRGSGSAPGKPFSSWLIFSSTMPSGQLALARHPSPGCRRAKQRRTWAFTQSSVGRRSSLINAPVGGESASARPVYDAVFQRVFVDLGLQQNPCGGPRCRPDARFPGRLTPADATRERSLPSESSR